MTDIVDMTAHPAAETNSAAHPGSIRRARWNRPRRAGPTPPGRVAAYHWKELPIAVLLTDAR